MGLYDSTPNAGSFFRLGSHWVLCRYAVIHRAQNFSHLLYHNNAHPICKNIRIESLIEDFRRCDHKTTDNLTVLAVYLLKLISINCFQFRLDHTFMIVWYYVQLFRSLNFRFSWKQYYQNNSLFILIPCSSKIASAFEVKNSIFFIVNLQLILIFYFSCLKNVVF